MAEQTTTTQIVQENPEIEAYRIGLLESAKKLADQPVGLPQYQVQGLTDLQKRALQRGEEGVGSFIPFIEQGYGTLGQGQQTVAGAMPGIQAGMLSALAAQPGIQAAMQQFQDPTAYRQYMDPYQEDVIAAAEADIARQAEMAQRGVAGQAVQAGAFGGSRAAVAGSELGRNYADQMARTTSALRSQGYQQAVDAARQAGLGMLQGASTQMQLGQGLGALAGQQGQLGAQMGQLGLQQASLGELQSQLGRADLDTLMQLGGVEQANLQASLDAQRQSELQKAYEPYQRLSFLSDIYGKTPSSQQTLSVGTSPSVSPFQQVAGLGIAGLSAAAGAQKAGLFG